MKVKICTGAKCTFYGASSVIDSVHDLKENLKYYPGIPENADFEIEIAPCQKFCQGNTKDAPVVYIDDLLIRQAKSQQVTALIIEKLKEQKNEE